MVEERQNQDSELHTAHAFIIEARSRRPSYRQQTLGSVHYHEKHRKRSCGLHRVASSMTQHVNAKNNLEKAEEQKCQLKSTESAVSPSIDELDIIFTRMSMFSNK